MNDDRSRQIRAKKPQQEKFANILDTGQFRQVFAEAALRQEVREKRRNLGSELFRLGDQFAIFVIEAQAQQWPVLSANVAFLEDKEILVVWQIGDRADACLVEPDFENRGALLIRVRHSNPRVRFRAVCAEGRQG